MAKNDPQLLAMQALSHGLADPAPRPLFGTKAKPGVFLGSSQAVKQAARLCLDSGWIEPTGQFVGTGKSKKELYRLSAAGVRQALEHSESAELLRDILAALDHKRELLRGMQSQISQVAELLQVHSKAVGHLLAQATAPAQRQPPFAPSTLGGLKPRILEILRDYHRLHPFAHCPLPELYRRVTESSSLTIGQFHDCLRQLASERVVVLHPYTGPAYGLENEQLALLMGQEIKYFAEAAHGTP